VKQPRRTALLLFLAALSIGLSPYTSLGAASAATYLVNYNGDIPDANPGDGLCDTGSWAGNYCTLRAAIEEANADGTSSTIQFAQPFTGLQQLSSCNLPPISAPNTTLDASSQWDTNNDRPGVEIISAVCHPLLSVTGDNTRIYGLLFGGTANIGIQLSSANAAEIGGGAPGRRNVFINGTGIKANNSSNAWIQYNYFGTIDGTGTISSSYGLWLEGASSALVEYNLVGGHTTLGILVNGQGNTLRHNVIGMNKLQTAALPNALGMGVYSAFNTIGPGNVVAGNTGHGIEVKNTADITITGNYVGLVGTSFGNGGNGLHVQNTARTRVLGNALANSGASGLWSNSQSGLIQGNGIVDNALDGIYLSGGLNQIGGDGLGNGLAGNGNSGLRLDGGLATYNMVMGNYVGLDSGAFEHGNQHEGIAVVNGASYNTIGGSEAGAGNWIGFNDWSGIFIAGAATTGNSVLGNVVGAAVNYIWQAPNGNHGIALYAGTHDNTIGGPGAGNIVLASNWSALGISESHTNTVAFNYLGTNGGSVHWGNVYYGVHLAGGAHNVFYFNEIAYNGSTLSGPGVLINGPAAIANTVRLNSIHTNGGAGIALQNGGNGSLAAPTVSTASCDGPVIGTACPNCTVDIYSDSADEGYQPEDSVTASPAGAFSWNGAPVGPYVTATATDSNGNTSPFSPAVYIGACHDMFLPYVRR